jgi:hypothetical protein
MENTAKSSKPAAKQFKSRFAILGFFLIWIGYEVFYISTDKGMEEIIRKGMQAELLEVYVSDRNYARMWGLGIGACGLVSLVVAVKRTLN